MVGVAPTAAAQADADVAAVADDPAGRLAMATDFYRDCGGPEFRYERAPLAFMHWEVRRGVLAPVAAGGSAWWRAVNGRLLRDADEARLIVAAGDTAPGSNAAVERWLTFVRSPSRASWYAAHNTSIAMGYIDNVALAHDEVVLEQLLMSNTITRVLFAEALEDGHRLDLGVVARVGRWLGDPRTPGVASFVDVPDFYPDHYPLTPEDDRRLTHRVVSLEDLLAAAIDDDVVAPLVPRVFADAAQRLALADLERFVVAGVVGYSWALLPAVTAAPEVADRRPSMVWRALAHLGIAPAEDTVRQ